MKHSRLLTITLLLLAFTACDPGRVFEKNIKIPDYQWDYNNRPAFEVEIEDTALRYNLYLNIRHAWQYPYSNMWVIVHTEFPDGERLEKRLELEIADKSGKPYADCSGDICDLSIPIQKRAVFPKAGIYRWEIEQNMRQNPLPMIIAVGFRVEVAEAE